MSVDDEPRAINQGKRLKGMAAMKLHCFLLLGLAICALAFRFELSRALGGNALSWAYVGEWPCFAGFGLYFWWFIFNGRERRPRKSSIPTVAPEYANMATQWQSHQRDLLASREVHGGNSNAQADLPVSSEESDRSQGSVEA